MKILLSVLLVLFLLGQLRLGAGMEYDASGLSLYAKLGVHKFTLLRLALYPAPKKKKRRKKKKKKPRPKPEPAEKPPHPRRNLGGALDLARELLPVALNALSSFREKLVVDRLTLRVIAGAEDPADAVMIYGGINAMLGALWLPMTQMLHIREGSAHADVDFQQHSTTLYAQFVFSLKIAQLICLGLMVGIHGLGALMRYRRKRQQSQNNEEGGKNDGQTAPA